ncbi:unnamed protein product [Schistosoma curassoni]|uniref:Sporulation protein YjcZ n=1 Tax=Schistosoma curassoni TaxID=6186 RepID=A0A183JEZ5_9TREM|nr:unnamed protein product [Schistosoma curassoni]
MTSELEFVSTIDDVVYSSGPNSYGFSGVIYEVNLLFFGCCCCCVLRSLRI